MGKKAMCLTVELTVLGMPFVGLNGGPQFSFDEAISSRRRRFGKRLRLVQGPVRAFLANRSACANGRAEKLRPRGRQGRDGRNDADEEDRHRDD
jgi:hypothetical protein